MGTLREAGVVDVALAAVEGPTRAVMLYGSHARGDAQPDSDVDVLELVPVRSRSYVKGSVSVVAYNYDQLESMVDRRSIFAWHLKTEGKILLDYDDLLRETLDRHRGPDTGSILRRIAELGSVVDLRRVEFSKYQNRAIRTARYLLRTAVYAHAVAGGGTSFNIRLAAQAANASQYLHLLERGAETAHDWTTFKEFLGALRHLVGPLSENPYGSLEALAVNAWSADRGLSSLAIQTLLQRGGEIEYATLPPPVL